MGIIIKIAKFYTRLKQGFVIVRCRFSLSEIKKGNSYISKKGEIYRYFSDIVFLGDYWEVKVNNYILYTYNPIC